MDRDQLTLQVKEHIIKYLNLLEMKPADIENDKPLFGEGLNLDSIDSLELAVMMEREYGVKITDPKEGRKVFVSVNSIVDHILEHPNKKLIGK